MTEKHSSRFEKMRTAFISVLAACGITVLKLLAAIYSGSIGMFSEAAHSALDLVASLITLTSVSFSDLPADENHPYGHEKIENLAAFTETLLMLGSVIWIMTEAVRRIFLEHYAVRISVWPFAVLLLSMVVDFFRSRALGRVATHTGSPALEADAMHFGMDMWSSLAVIVGLLANYLGTHLHLAWLRLGDPLSAVVVSVIILKVCWRLTRQAIDVLIDTAPRESRRKILEELARTEGILAIERVRLRRSGNQYFVDLKLAMARNISFQRSELIKENVTTAVHRVLPAADVVIYAVPRSSRSESIFDRVRAVAAHNNLSVHDVSVQDWNGQLHLEQHLEVPESLTLRAAHELVTRIEAEMRAEIPEIRSILTHIEGEHTTIERHARQSADHAIEVRLRSIARTFPEILDVHDVAIGLIGEHLRVACHCTLADDTPMAEVHSLITTLEDAVKAELPEITRVFIHPEPATDNRR
ncbi:MAG TPA: cation diffusion facilitator family transporter [Acidobacteriaceae bacterium]|jgi:cation diffusion facilitator family transporter|nr:cation diffusion facilitator family transporter [Acidobacteriaceae bacterium]